MLIHQSFLRRTYLTKGQVVISLRTKITNSVVSSALLHLLVEMFGFCIKSITSAVEFTSLGHCFAKPLRLKSSYDDFLLTGIYVAVDFAFNTKQSFNRKDSFFLFLIIKPISPSSLILVEARAIVKLNTLLLKISIVSMNVNN